MLLRLATLWTSGRLSRNKGRVWIMLKLKRLPTHITPEVLNSLTGLDALAPEGSSMSPAAPTERIRRLDGRTRTDGDS